jgi:hypothetical protein
MCVRYKGSHALISVRVGVYAFTEQVRIMKGKTPTPLQRFNFLVAAINKLWILIVSDQH